MNLFPKAFPDAELAWSSSSPEQDSEAASKIIQAARDFSPIQINGRAWFITEISVIDGTLEARGIDADSDIWNWPDDCTHQTDALSPPQTPCGQ